MTCNILLFFFYSYVHTRLGSFLPSAPTPSLTTHSSPSHNILLLRAKTISDTKVTDTILSSYRKKKVKRCQSPLFRLQIKSGIVAKSELWVIDMSF
jgi:hypothetical protein